MQDFSDVVGGSSTTSTKRYKLKDNLTGKVHTLIGPADATDEELSAELEKILAEDEAKAKPPQSSRGASQVALDQINAVNSGYLDPFKAAFEGAKNTLKGPMGHYENLKSAVGGAVDTVKGLYDLDQGAREVVVGALPDPVQSRVRPVSGAIEAPNPDEYEGHARAAGANLSGTLLGKATEVFGGKALRNIEDRVKYSQDRPVIFTQPEGHWQQALKLELEPKDLKLSGDLIKHGEAMIKKPVKDIDSLRLAEKAVFETDLMPRLNAIIDPQKTVTIPRSGRALRQAAVDSIPKDILPGTLEYDNLVRQITESIPGDLTLGQLRDMVSSLNQQNATVHSAKLGQALSKMETATKAIDMGKEAASRRLMYEGMDRMGLGGADAVREINKRVGLLIKVRDAVDGLERTARTEATTPTLRRGVQLAKATVGTVKGPQFTINENIASAMRKWKTETGLDIMARTRLPLPTSRQLPANASPSMQMGEGWSGGTGGVTTPVVVEGSRASRTGRMIPEKAGSPHVMPEGWEGGTGGVTGQELAEGTQSTRTRGQRLLPSTGEPTNVRTPGQVFEKLSPQHGQYWMEGEAIPRVPEGATFLGTVKPADVSRLQVISETKRLAYDPVTGQQFTYVEPQRAYSNKAATPINSPMSPAELTPDIKVESGYGYHATNIDNLRDIAQTGKLKTNPPSFGTDQDAWPDGRVEKRAYFSERNPHMFAPTDGEPVLIRTKSQLNREAYTGDLFTTKPIPTSELEYLGRDGQWHPVSGLKTPLKPPPKRTSKR